MTRTRGLVAVIVIQFACLGYLGWQVVDALNQVARVANSEGAIASTANRTANLANRAANLVAADRRQTILSTCRAQNRRHDNTIRELHHIVSGYAKHLRNRPAQRRQLQASVASSTLLISALAPRQNCQQLVKQEAGR